MDVAASESCQIDGIDISEVEPFGSATRMLVQL
jgi:hypothetical protein